MLIEPNSEGRFRQPGSPEDEREFNRERNEELAAALAGEIDWQTRCADLERQNAAMRAALEMVIDTTFKDATGQHPTHAWISREAHEKIRATLQLGAGGDDDSSERDYDDWSP